MFRELLLVALIGVVSSSPGGLGAVGIHGVHGVHGGLGAIHAFAPAKYSFAYGVQDPHYGSNFGHAESREGYNTKGEYYVNLPDGRVQTVTYTADEHGYHPVVTYSGKAHFPVHPKGGYGH